MASGLVIPAESECRLSTDTYFERSNFMSPVVDQSGLHGESPNWTTKPPTLIKSLGLGKIDANLLLSFGCSPGELSGQ